MLNFPFTDEAKQILAEYHSHPSGLSSKEAKDKLFIYGENILVEKKESNLIIDFLLKFNNPLILILLFASAISALTGEFTNFIIIFLIVLFSVVVDFFQEYQSEKAAEKLKQKVSLKTIVLRDGEKKEVPVSQLTLSDVVFLSIGNIVPADMKILYAKDLHLDESTLTGESFPQEKTLGDDIYMGSSVVNGEVIGVITAVGVDTQFGKIAHSLSSQKPVTDFQKGIRDFGYLVVKITAILVSFIFLFNLFFRHDFINSLIFALALAVGLTPELLPLIVTVNLVQGALRMSKKGVIVKHLPSIQNFGSMNILCTDKTGTLTENKIILERYESIGIQNDKRVLLYAYLNSFFQSNMKSPLDDAVLAHKELSTRHYKKIDEIPFDFVRRRLSVIVKIGSENLLICKGAPEEIMNITTHYDDTGEIKPLTSEVKKKIKKRFEEFSADGFRVLAIAYKTINEEKETYEKTDEKGVVFLGLTAFFDPPKAEADETLRKLEHEGIQLKILTGDNELVTQKVCKELNISIQGIILGKELADLHGKELQKAIIKTTIFARVNPDQKQEIISTLKTAGYIVGYLGDGVNDAASLKTADIGISVNNAVDVAKEAADIILLNKSLRILQEGVKEGRKTFANVMKYILVGMGSNFGNMLSVCLASLFLPFLPMLPVQILLNNLLYDLSQLAIPFDSVDFVFFSKPLRWNIDFIKKTMLVFGPISSLFDFLTFFVLLYIFKGSVDYFRSGWFVESMVTQSLIILSLRTSIVPFFASKPNALLVFSSISTSLFALLITQIPLSHYFQFTHLDLYFYLYLIIAVLGYFYIVEIAKHFFYKSNSIQNK